MVDVAMTIGQQRFDAAGIEADTCLVKPDETARPQIIEALARKPYAVVVVGGGIRKPEPMLELFEIVINLIRQHAPQASIAFNTIPRTASTPPCAGCPPERRVSASGTPRWRKFGAEFAVPCERVPRGM
jgi:hypothetical protein